MPLTETRPSPRNALCCRCRQGGACPAQRATAPRPVAVPALAQRARTGAAVDSPGAVAGHPMASDTMVAGGLNALLPYSSGG